MGLLLRLALNALAIWVAVQLVDGLSFVGDNVQLVLTALLMGAVNAIVKPVVKVLSLPLVILTLGLFLLVVNIAMFALVVALSGSLGLGLDSSGLGATALGALIATVVIAVGERLLPD